MSICRNLFDQLYSEYAAYCIVFYLFSECRCSGIMFCVIVPVPSSEYFCIDYIGHRFEYGP